EPARDIAAGVILEQRKSVPERRRQQHERRPDAGADPPGDARLCVRCARADVSLHVREPCENGKTPTRRGARRGSDVVKCAIMFVTFFHELKAAGVPVTLREYLTLVEAMEKDLAGRRVEDFYYLARAALIKDERNLDKFDRVFGHVFKGLTMMSEALEAEIPSQW